MNRRIKVILIAVILLFAVVCAVVFGLFHLDMQRECYLFDGSGGEMLAETTLSVKGWVNPLSRIFSGSILIPEYPVTQPGEKSEGSVDWSGGERKIVYTCGKAGVENGVVVSGVSDASYVVHLFGNQAGAVIVEIRGGHAGSGIYAVCAEDQASAAKLLLKFLNEKTHPLMADVFFVRYAASGQRGSGRSLRSCCRWGHLQSYL